MWAKFEPSFPGRLISLVFGVLYLLFWSAIFSFTSGVPFWIAATFVVVGAAAIFAVLAMFCMILVERNKGGRRFRLSSVLLVFIPQAVYLTAIHLLILPTEDRSPASWIYISAFCVLFVAISTAAILRCGEAIVWLLLFMVRRPKSKTMDQRGCVKVE
jgi:hypothetical protein